ncbi:hypothetical protein KSB_33490 [Ktedonobacter robiniae]|uniref:Uncharacterized protein n=1 Tax=Ktedonobacter robiniae TaxID=2778365 RepID=A0ABQ3UQ32_9CHLR|nr:hypothetical protein KSB_33490 [Ktedonobacter robiniae]
MLYPDMNQILITADGGGFNGVRNRLWKRKLQELADEEQLTLTIVHYPPATSKWNTIEHRLFSFIETRRNPLGLRKRSTTLWITHDPGGARSATHWRCRLGTGTRHGRLTFSLPSDT